MTALTDLLCAICDFSAAFGLLSFFYSILDKKILLKKPRIAFASALLLLPTVTVAFFPRLPEPLDAIPDFFSFAVCFFAAMLLLEKPRFFRTLGVTVFYMFTVEVFWSLAAYYTVRDAWLEYAVCAVLYVLSGVGAKLMRDRFGGATLRRYVSAIPKWAYAALIVFEITCCYKAYGEKTERFDSLFLISSAGLIITFLLLLMRIMRMARDENSLLRQIEIQKEYIEAEITDDEELRSFRHDYKNHMIVVNSLLDGGRLSEAKKYLSDIQEPVRAGLNRIRTGNFAADAIINQKAREAAESDIKLHFTGSVPAEGISAEDVCTIFSNLLDNAIEACRNAAENRRSACDGQTGPTDALSQNETARHIFVEAEVKRGVYILSISNPTDANNSSPGEKPKTTKRDKRNHGFGLGNVERAVRKYDGTFETVIQSGVFRADVMINPVSDRNNKQQ